MILFVLFILIFAVSMTTFTAGIPAFVVGFLLKGWTGAILGGVVGTSIILMVDSSSFVGGAEKVSFGLMLYPAYFVWALLGAHLIGRIPVKRGTTA